MDKTEILNIVNEPSKHIQIVKIDGKDSIVYSSKFVELLELIPTMLTKTNMEQIRAEIEQEYKNESEHPYGQGLRRAIKIIDKYRGEQMTRKEREKAIPLSVIDEIKAEIENLPTGVELTDGSIREFAFKNYKKGLLKIIDEKVKEHTHYYYCEKCSREGLKASKSLDELYKQIYDHHHEITLSEDSEYKRGLLSLSKWVLDLMASDFDCEYKAEINPQESEDNIEDEEQVESEDEK